MTDTTFCFIEATGVVDCHVFLDDEATAAFAIEVRFDKNKASHWLSKLDAHLNHASEHSFRVNGPDRDAEIMVKVPCSSAPEIGANVFIKAVQGATVLRCLNGAGHAVPAGPRGVNVGKVQRNMTSVFHMKVMK